MKAGWKIVLAVASLVVALPLAANAGHGHHHHGGGYGYGYGGCCGCGGQIQYAPPVHAQYGQPTPAVAQQPGAGYQSFSYSPTPAGTLEAGQVAPAMSSPTYYQPAAAYGSGYYGGYSGNHWGARVYNNAANKTLGRNDYGLGRR